ncbi:MAG: hypothetical protein ACFFDW_08595 [Candidatus Thorarchaeota archaeon]
MNKRIKHVMVLFCIFYQFSLLVFSSSNIIINANSRENNITNNFTNNSESTFVLTPADPSLTIDDHDNIYLIYKEYNKGYSQIMLLKFNGTTQEWNLTKIPFYIPESNERITVYPAIKWYNHSFYFVFSLETLEYSKLILSKINPVDLSYEECFAIANNNSFLSPNIMIYNDLLWMSWQNGAINSYSLYYVKYDLQTANYDSIHIVANSTFGNCQNNKIFVDENSICYFIWSQGDSNQHKIHYMSIASNHTILNNLTITSGETDCIDPAIWVEKNGNVHLFWSNFTDIAPQMLGTKNIYTQVFKKDVGWSSMQCVAPYIPPDREGMMIDAQNPSITQDKFGNIWLGYEVDEPYPYFKGVAVRYVLSNGIWQPREVVSTGVAPGYDPQLVCDSTGTLHMVWLDFRWNYYELYYRSRRADGYWFVEQQLTSYTIEQVNSKKWIVLVSIFGAILIFGIVIPSSFYFLAYLKKKKKNKVIKEYLKDYKIDEY